MAAGKRVGFIGLGLMGSGMASNIARKHGQLNVCDVDRAAVERLVAKGASAKATPKEVGSTSDVVLLSLPHPEASKQVVLGADGLAQGMARGTTVVGLSTDGIEAVRDIEAGRQGEGHRLRRLPGRQGAAGGRGGRPDAVCLG